MDSLRREIESLSNPTPNFDPEEDIDTDFRVFSKEDDLCAETSTEDFHKSSLKSRAAPLLEDVDPNYAGRKVSRKSLEIYQEDYSLLKDTDTDQSTEEELSSDDSAVSDHKSEQSSDIEDDCESSNEKDQVYSKSCPQAHYDRGIEKGEAIRNQIELYNRLLEMRIKLQKLLILANKQPQKESLLKLKESGSKQDSESIVKGCGSVKQLLNSLLKLHSKFEKSLPDFQQATVANPKAEAESDEEISSESDENISKMDDVTEIKKNNLKRKPGNIDYNDTLTKKFKCLVPFRDSIIQKWDDKIRLSSGRMTQKSFAAFNNSTLKQIEQILQDRTRLINRTRLKRSLYRVLGTSDKEENIHGAIISSKQDMLLKNCDPEIFDDDDFYRLLLRDVIDSKSFGSDAATIRKQMEIQKMRNKMKKIVDTKASKGRKLRYDIHSKLVNFMAPFQVSTVSDETRENLLKCLFGRSSL